jgi:hypothetical protein
MTAEAIKKHGGARPGAGQPQKLETRPPFATALEYAMAVINDNNAAVRRRDAMAMHVLRHIEAPTTKEPTGKHAERKEAAIIAADKFEVPAPPLRITVQ